MLHPHHPLVCAARQSRRPAAFRRLRYSTVDILQRPRIDKRVWVAAICADTF